MLFNVWQPIANVVASLVSDCTLWVTTGFMVWRYQSHTSKVVAALANTVVIAVLGTALITVYNRYFVKQKLSFIHFLLRL